MTNPCRTIAWPHQVFIQFEILKSRIAKEKIVGIICNASLKIHTLGSHRLTGGWQEKPIVRWGTFETSGSHYWDEEDGEMSRIRI